MTPVPGDEAGKIHDREVLTNGQPTYARNKMYYYHQGTVYGAEKRDDGTPRVYMLSPHEDEDVYAMAQTKGRTGPTAEAPAIDPVGLTVSGLSGGIRSGVQANGSALNRLSAGIKGGAISAGRNIVLQQLGIKCTTIYCIARSTT